jgi:energy-coupling factor transporter transmembrane protein EcfT
VIASWVRATIADTAIELERRGPRRVSPFFIPASLINLVSGQVSIRFGFKGPTHAVVTACSTGAHAIGDASRMIALGAPWALAGLATLAALTALYFLRNRFRPHTVSSLFLWRHLAATREGGVVLRRLRVPSDELALMVTIALRFIPTLLVELDTIMRAQRARQDAMQMFDTLQMLFYPKTGQGMRTAPDQAKEGIPATADG